MTTYYKQEDGVRVEMTPAEVSQFEIDMANRISEVSESMRVQRNALLAETDWWASSDYTMTTEQTAYRQALRDITGQAGFPTDITWPTKP